MFNFRSLAAMIGEDEKEDHAAEHHENIETPTAERKPAFFGAEKEVSGDGNGREDGGESSGGEAVVGHGRGEITS